MPLYMTQASYTSDSWAAQISNPLDRSEHLRGMLETAGGRLHSLYYAFGEYDVVLIFEAPDNTTAASVLIAAAGGGAIAKLQTTVLMSAEDGLEAIRGARAVGYRPPG